MKNLKLKALLIEKFETCVDAAEAMGNKIHPTSLSRIIQGRRIPTAGDRAALAKILTPAEMQRVFDGDDGNSREQRI